MNALKERKMMLSYENNEAKTVLLNAVNDANCVNLEAETRKVVRPFLLEKFVYS